MREIYRRLNERAARKSFPEHFTEQGEEVPYERVVNLIRNPESFAVPCETFSEELYPDVTLRGESIDLGGGHFVNKYDLSFPLHSNEYDARVVTLRHPLYQHRIFNEASPEYRPGSEIIASINGAFFYLQDDPSLPAPEEIMYHLNIRNGRIVGLPSATREAVVTNMEGDLRVLEVQAQGRISVGSLEFAWKGGQGVAHAREEYVLDDTGVYLFNSGCCSIAYDDPNDKTTLRRLQVDRNKTPEGEDKMDIIVKLNEEGELVVGEVRKGGGTDFFAGNFILHGSIDNLNKVQPGDPITPLSIDGHDPKDISSAMTVGPKVHHFLEHDDHEINHDPSLGTFPPFAADSRYARSVIYADTENRVHFLVFDGVPRSAHMKGVTPREAALHVPKDALFAAFLDGGQSARFTYRTEEEQELGAYGNKQYVRLHAEDKTSQGITPDARYLWSQRGRPTPSMIVLARKK